MMQYCGCQKAHAAGGGWCSSMLVISKVQLLAAMQPHRNPLQQQCRSTRDAFAHVKRKPLQSFPCRRCMTDPHA